MTASPTSWRNAGLDAVADDVGVLDRHPGRHDQVELDEGDVAGLPGAQIVRLDGAGGVGRDRAAHAAEHLRVRRLVHQRAHRIAEHRVAGPDDVERHQAGDHRVEAKDAGHVHQGEAGQHAAGGPDIRQYVLAAGQQGRGFPPSADADHEPAPAGIHQVARPFRAMPCSGASRAVGFRPDVVDLMQDGHRRAEDHHALDDGREIFRLLVPVGMVVIGRLAADVQGNQRGAGGNDVDDALQRVGIQRHAAGDPPGGEFQADHDQADAEGAPGHLHAAVHRRSPGWRAMAAGWGRLVRGSGSDVVGRCVTAGSSASLAAALGLRHDRLGVARWPGSRQGPTEATACAAITGHAPDGAPRQSVFGHEARLCCRDRRHGQCRGGRSLGAVTRSRYGGAASAGRVKRNTVPAARVRLRPQPAAMRLDDGAADRQPDAHAVALGGDERLEQPRQDFRPNAAAGVGDADQHHSAGRRGAGDEICAPGQCPSPRRHCGSGSAAPAGSARDRPPPAAVRRQAASAR